MTYYSFQERQKRKQMVKMAIFKGLKLLKRVDQRFQQYRLISIFFFFLVDRV